MWSLNPWLPSLTLPLLPCALIAETPRSVGIVAERSGEVLWDGGGGVRLFDDIPPLKAVVLGKGARLTILTLETGDELVFQGPARLRFTPQGLPEGSSPLERRKVPAALRGALGFKPGTLAQAGVVMREVSGERIQKETSPTMILGPGHRLRWKGAGKGVSYRLRVSDTLGDLLFLRETPDTSLVIPEGVALSENDVYRWTAEALKVGRVLSTQSGRFALLPKAQREQLEQARPQPGASFAQKLLFATLLEQLQVREEANSHWLALAKERPLDPVLERLISDLDDPH